MGFGRYQDNRQYKQENATQNLGPLARMMRLQTEQYNKIGETVDKYGKGRASSKAAQLIGSGALQEMTPEQQQAAILQVTGGRDMSEQGGQNLESLLGMSGDRQANTWNEESATTLFGRQNSQIAQRHANSLGRMAQQNKYNVARDSATAKLTGTNGLMSPRDLAETKAKIDGLTDAIANNDLDPAAKSNAEKRLTELKVQYTRGASKKPSSAATGYAIGIDKNGNAVGSGSTSTNYGRAQSNKNGTIKVSPQVQKATNGMGLLASEAVEYSYRNFGVEIIKSKKKEDGTYTDQKFMRDGQEIPVSKMITLYESRQ